MKEHLYTMLSEYSTGDMVPMHMPGHKRNPMFQMKNPYELDITEITGFDNLHHPEGVLRELMDHVTKCYGSEQSYLLVNGSTCGILASLTACCQRGDRILVARNCHKSVYNAIRLLELRPVYLYPDGDGGDMEVLGIAGSIRKEAVAEMLRRYSDVACVMITSPTYEGIVSPVSEIAEVVHEKGIPLIVDEAHGAHFHWHPAFPKTALEEGADLVVESLHKTLPAFTQTGVLHAKFQRVKKARLEWALQTYQSSSPSYLLMASMDQCFQFLEQEGTEAFGCYVKRLEAFRKEMESLMYLTLFETPQKEMSKIVISTETLGMTGQEFADILYRDFHIELEMSCGNYCIAMTSVCDEATNLERLAQALLALDHSLGMRAKKADGSQTTFRYTWQHPERVLYSYEVPNFYTETVALTEAAGRTAAVDIYLYPPGIPLVVAGERISEDIIKLLLAGQKAGYEVKGVKEEMTEVLQ